MKEHVAAHSSAAKGQTYSHIPPAAAALLHASDPMDLDALVRIANRPVAVGRDQRVTEMAALFPAGHTSTSAIVDDTPVSSCHQGENWVRAAGRPPRSQGEHQSDGTRRTRTVSVSREMSEVCSQGR